MIARNFRRSQQQFLSSAGIGRLPIFQNNFRRNASSASAAVKNTEHESMDERIGGVPVHEGPSTSLPVGGERQISSHIRELVEQIASLSLLEASDLNYALKKRLNIPDQPMGSAMMMPMAGMMATAAAAQQQGNAGQQQQQEEADIKPTKTSYTLKLEKFDESKKVALIKEVRSLMLGTNLIQAKKLIESAPVEIKGDIGMAEAEEMKAKLEAQGAVCIIE